MKDMRLVVEKGYDSGDYYGFYRKNRKLHSFEQFLFKELQKKVQKGKLLDLGCGPGVPYDKYFVKQGYNVTGVDLSQKHIDIANKNVRAKFVKADFSKYKFKDKYDIIVSFFAIFHIPKEEHGALFKKMFSILNTEGCILITLGKEETKASEEDFIGAKMMWSSNTSETSLNLLQQAGFKILFSALESITHNGEETHLWVLAQK